VAAAEVQAKERLPADLLPHNVVLYQYQACPFCNKVRGEINFPITHFRFGAQQYLEMVFDS
jgi:hypothetical protein